jgi:hypothetical protein
VCVCVCVRACDVCMSVCVSVCIGQYEYICVNVRGGWRMQEESAMCVPVVTQVDREAITAAVNECMQHTPIGVHRDLQRDMLCECSLRRLLSVLCDVACADCCLRCVMLPVLTAAWLCYVVLFVLRLFMLCVRRGARD